MVVLRAPFPWFGGKSRVAAEVWREFGDVANYVEPFAGSLAVLLGRPGGAGHHETVNDLDGFISNFWRALATDPEAVRAAADWPVNEADLHARHAWLVTQRDDLTARLMGDPLWFNARLAGWWVWGCCAWIGAGWCSGEGPWSAVDGRLVSDGGQGVKRKLPHLGDGGRGVNRQLPHLGNGGRGVNRQRGWDATALASRLREVRVACGDWARVLGRSVTTRHGITGVLLDPPYGEGDAGYACDTSPAAAVWGWAVEHGADPLLRIAVCGYDDGREVPRGWRAAEWKAKGGYGGQGKGENVNATRERIWFSPHCLGSGQLALPW